MIRVTYRVRRGNPVECDGCDSHIKPGEAYREAIAIRHDAFDRPFVRLVAHEHDVSSDPNWDIRDTMPRRRR